MADMKASIKLDVGVDGAQSIEALADELHEVSKVVDGELKQAAQGAARQLRELARQDAAIDAFRALSADADKTQRALKAAERELANYSAQVGKGALATREQADGLVRLQGAVNSTREAHQKSSAALKDASEQLTRMGISTKDTAAAQERLRAQVAQVRGAVQGLTPAYQGVAQGAQQAGATMVRTHRQIGDGVDSISKQLAALQSVFLAVAGARQFAGMARDVAQTADAINNLRSRIELVTGAGNDFAAAWDGVQRVALATHGALEETGALFARVAQAGKDAGLNTQQASEQSLRLVETINQATQLSGASAQASSAAITQLVQGFQSGVLRGDEFNSVMEQAPRLAKALADGLGVTTGELRKMAEAGALSTQTVIDALKGQSDAVAQEFAKLPPTVGRALQDLSTKWTLYVGELDKSSGASSAAAAAIQALAGNLRTLGGLLLDAGQATAAFVALGVAQHFLGLATASKRAAVEMAALGTVSEATAERVKAAGVAAQRFDTIVKGLKTFALLTIATNFKDIGTWIGEAAAKLMGYRDRSAELAEIERKNAAAAKEAAAEREHLAQETQKAIAKQFDLSAAAAAAVAQFDRLTAGGMSAAGALARMAKSFDLSSVQGLKDFRAALDALAAGGKLSAEQLGQALKQALVDSFDAAIKKSGDVEAAIKTLAASLNFKDVQGASSFVLALDELAAKGKLSAAQVGDAWQQALSKLNAGQIGALRANLEEAARQGVISAKQWAQANEQILANSFKTLGVNAAQALGQVSEGAREAINSIDLVADSAKAAGVGVEAAARAIEMAFVAAIPKADSLEAIKALEDKLKAMGAAGQIGADGIKRVQEELRKQKAAIEGQIPGIQSVEEALRNLGVKPQAELKALADKARESFAAIKAAGTATPREINEAWKAMAEAAIAANQGVADGMIKAQASQYGFVVETDAAGKSIVKSMAEAKQATLGVSDAAKQAAGEMKGMSDAAWQLGGDLVEQARKHNAALGPVQASWMDAEAAASKYARQVAELLAPANKAIVVGADNVRKLREEHAQLIAVLEGLDRQQKAMEDQGSGAARGVEELRLRLLELQGTEEQVARARHDAQMAEARRKLALLRIDAERAQVNRDDAQAERLGREIALMNEQLALLDQVFAAEEQQRRKRASEKTDGAARGGGNGGGAAGGSGGGGGGGLMAPAGGAVNITVNANGVNDPVRLARLIEPELARLGRLAR